MSPVSSKGDGRPFGVGVIGCGNISKQYLKNLATFPDVRVLFCADIDAGRAKAQAAAYGVPASGSPEQAFEHPGVQLVVNLTIPAAHAEVAGQAVAAGQHVWNEKPLALDTAAGRGLLAAAVRAGVRVGCAPDTVLGAGLQTARRLIDDGVIGEPQSALALMQDPGPQRWHHDPEFLFRRGAGPLFDMGPYYLTTLATLFGPAEQVRNAPLGFKLVEQPPYPLEIVDRLEIIEQVGMAAHDQLAFVALPARPARETCRHDLLRQ